MKTASTSLGHKPQQDNSGNITNIGVQKMLPPGVKGNAQFGNLFLDMGELHWLTYDGKNFLEDYGKGPKIQDLYANFRFWGEDPNSKGVFLKFKNGLKQKRETATTKYRYQIMCPEPAFERYIDDMGALVVNFYSVQEGLTIGTSKIIVKLYVKRHKQPGDMGPIIELRGTFPITLIGDLDYKIGEFSFALTSSFANPTTQIPKQILEENDQQQLQQNKRDMIDLNEDSFEMNEQQAKQLAQQQQNARLHEQMNQDNRIPSSLQNRGANASTYNQSNFADYEQERPTRDRNSQKQIQNQRAENSRNLTGKNLKDLNFQNRQQINIDENEDTFTNQDSLNGILARGERLRKQMADALDPSTSAWEQIHGIHEVPRTYVPPFMQNEMSEMKGMYDQNDQSPSKIKDKMYDIEVEAQAQNPNQASPIKANPRNNANINYDQEQNLEDFAEQEANRRQIKDMKFIRVKVKNVRIESKELLHKFINENFNLKVTVPLPDINLKKIQDQTVQLNNYEVISNCEFAFNSLSLYNFRVDGDTLGQYVMSKLRVGIVSEGVEGSLDMNKLILAPDFRLEETIDLEQSSTVVKKTGDPTKKRQQEVQEIQKKYVGSITVEMNLQSGDAEDEMKRNYQIKMLRMEEERTKQEQERQEIARKKMQFVMEQAPVFGQLYLHIQKLGHADNIGERTSEQIMLAQNAASQGRTDQQIVGRDNEANIMIQDTNQDGLGSTLNERTEGTLGPSSDSLARQEESKQNSTKILLPKRNLFVQFKAFPNLEKLATNPAWQQNEDQIFNYRSQFPVLMSPETLEKMEKFIFVLELWDQISPSVQEFLGLVKIPLAPICYSMKTTDDEIYSLNFMADQFCMYPMIVTDGFLPIYSPKLGQNIGHIKVTLAMGSPVQVNRLIQKEQEEERRIQLDIEKKKIEEAERLKEQEIKAAKRAKKEKKRQLEEERQQREQQDGGLQSLLGGVASTQKGSKSLAKMPQANLNALLRQSLNSNLSGHKADYDQRNQSMLNCMRKLFEESRAQSIEELNGESLFKDEVKNFSGQVQKDEFVYAFLNNQQFSLTRIDISQIVALMQDINRDDAGMIDIDELHFSYRSYIKYYELIEQRIIDMFEKYKISIVKKFEMQDLILEFVAEIESKADESKMSIVQFREILEDRHGIQIRDALYDQFGSFFDLDRDQQVYITSFCEYIKQPTSQKINFFKVNTNVIVNQISEYVKNSVEASADCIAKLEEEFKQEIWKNSKLRLQNANMDEQDEIDVIPTDLLINEKINAKLFQYKLRRMGIALSLWEVFTLFEMLNTKSAKMYFEPQRYHQVMFGNFYKFIQNQEYNRSEAKKPREKSRSRSRSNNRGKQQVPAPAKDQYDSRPGAYDIEEHGYKQGRGGYSEEESIANESEKGYWHKNEDSDTEDPRQPYKQVKHIFEIKVKELKNIPVLNKFIVQSQNKAENNIHQSISAGQDNQQKAAAKAQANKYIQNVAVKYSFPLDEDEILESDYLQLNKDALEQQGLYNYNVSMDTVHTYIIGKEDDIKRVLELCQSRGNQNVQSGYNEEYENGQILNSQQARREELFNMSIALYQDNREYIIGNAHLPIEDLVDAIMNYEQKTGTYDRRTKRTGLNRTLFLYGTSYSQRENCIIGKLIIELNYSREKLFLSKKEAKLYLEQQKEQKGNKKGDQELNTGNPYSCFMHRETYINRKIPLNAKLSVLIDRVSNLKESIENIEHFAKIQHSALGIDLENDDEYDAFKVHQQNDNLQQLSTTTLVHNKRDLHHLDRRRVLKHILKNGLNLIVRCSVFEEDQDLVKKFDLYSQEIQNQLDADPSRGVFENGAKYQTRMLFNSLNPVFGEVFEMNLQMDTKIFEYLKNKRAVFEVRHYIIESYKQKQSKMRQSQANMGGNDLNQRRQFDDENESQATVADEDVIDQCDYIVLGYVRVPLLQLITKNNGVDGDFTIFDEFKQKMGSLKLRITLNHHNSQRPLYSTSNKIPNQVQPSMMSNNLRTTLIDKSVSLNSQIRLGTMSYAQVEKHKFILGLDFIELILKNRKELVKPIQGQTQRFYLKFNMFNQVYQTKFFGEQNETSLSPLNILLQKINLQKFDINKATFIDIDITDQLQIEQAFGKPLEVQLWHKIESMRTYEKPIKEEMLGQFFIELNELSKTSNKRLKAQQAKQQPGKFQAYEGYFSLHESKRDILSSDRLGMRLYLFNKDDTNETLTIDNLNQLFNLYRSKIEQSISNKLDQHGKGYADEDDLIQVVKDQVPDEYLQNKAIWFMKTSLEYKSVDKLYYSPMFGLPPPFFKYSKKFDKLEIICRMNEELESLDSTDNGFIPANVFRNALEDELKIKSKIVEDFINSIRDVYIENSNVQSNTATVKEIQSLDVNLITNSLKSSHIDYIILLRKLSQFMEQNQVMNNAGVFIQNQIKDNIEDIRSAEDVKIYFEIDNGMRIKNPLSATDPPNTFVVMKPAFQNREHGQFVQTNHIKANAYPTWNFRSQNFTMPLNKDNMEFIESGGFLEFEVFHKAIGASNNLNVQESNHLIGVAFVPLKPLIEGRGKTRLTGMYDVVAKGNIYGQSVQSLSSVKAYENSFGKIKVCVTTDRFIRNMLDGNDGQSEYQPVASVYQSMSFQQDNASVGNVRTSKESPQRNVSFGNERSYNPFTSNSYTGGNGLQKENLLVGLELDVGDSQNLQNLDVGIRSYDRSLQSASDQQLDELHKMNMNDLDSLNKKLKDSMTVLDVQGATDSVGNYGGTSGIQGSNARVPDFGKSAQPAQPAFGGHTTFKTDMQRASLNQDINEFRQQHLKKAKQGGSFASGNPLESTEFNAGGSSLVQKPEWQDEDDITRQVEDEVERRSPSKERLDDRIGQRTADRARGLGAFRDQQPPRAGARPGGAPGQALGSIAERSQEGNYQPAFGQSAASDVENVFANNLATEDPDAHIARGSRQENPFGDEDELDEQEMQRLERIERIIKNQ